MKVSNNRDRWNRRPRPDQPSGEARWRATALERPI